MERMVSVETYHRFPNRSQKSPLLLKVSSVFEHDSKETYLVQSSWILNKRSMRTASNDERQLTTHGWCKKFLLVCEPCLKRRWRGIWRWSTTVWVTRWRGQESSESKNRPLSRVMPISAHSGVELPLCELYLHKHELRTKIGLEDHRR